MAVAKPNLLALTADEAFGLTTPRALPHGIPAQGRRPFPRPLRFGRRLGRRFSTDGTNPRSVLLPNGSLILPLPAHPGHARGFSANLLIIDEATRVSDEVYSAITPLIAATRGHLWLLSTPRGKRGFFYRESTARHAANHATALPWLRLSAPAEFLAAEQSRKTSRERSDRVIPEVQPTSKADFSPRGASAPP